MPKVVNYCRDFAARETSIPPTNTAVRYKINKTEYVREKNYGKNNFLKEEAALSRRQIQEEMLQNPVQKCPQISLGANKFTNFSFPT
jgi:hypothetical protein